MTLERSPRPVSVTVSEQSHFEYRVSGQSTSGWHAYASVRVRLREALAALHMILQFLGLGLNV